MVRADASVFKTKLLSPAKPAAGEAWAFLMLTKAASAKLPRRGRTSVTGTLNGHPFVATLEPDGQLSHWLRVSPALQKAAQAEVGRVVTVHIAPADPEPEPRVPDDLQRALAASPAARATWEATTTLPRVDWVHWIESAHQAKTRKRRVETACDMLASGEKRVCCFDPSGFYSKSLRAPVAADAL